MMQAAVLQTYRLGLVGYPVAHSLSPALHGAALRAAGVRGDYALYPVAPGDDRGLSELVSRVHNGELTGLNVTIPHKQSVIPYLDELTPAAGAIGAVNTIYLRDDRLVGDNTDAPGFLFDLKTTLFAASTPSANPQSKISSPEGAGVLPAKSALVLGAGGSARAVIYALLNDSWEVTVAARRIEQAQQLAEQFGSIRQPKYSLSAVPLSTFQSSNPHLIVNTTPVGMSPNIEASPWPESLPFPAGSLVYDLVYNPRETVLVRRARAAGLQATGGLGMLIEQAALAFEIWTGQRVARAVMLDAVNV